MSEYNGDAISDQEWDAAEALFEERRSGLVVPKQKSKPPTRKYGLLEIQNDENRETAIKALSLLWDAMGLSSGDIGIQLQNPSRHDTYYQMYRFIGELLLGDDCPEKGMLT